jgi:hypothetical protein
MSTENGNGNDELQVHSTPPPSDRKERAETRGLCELPATLENINAKLNHLVIHVELSTRASNSAREAAEEARELANQARSAAIGAGTNALKAVQSREPLSRKERFSTVFAGAAAGGALAWLVLTLLGFSSAAVAVSSCGAH